MVPLFIFELLLRAWLLLDRAFVLVFAGDSGQLAPFDEEGGTGGSNKGPSYWQYINVTCGMFFQYRDHML